MSKSKDPQAWAQPPNQFAERDYTRPHFSRNVDYSGSYRGHSRSRSRDSASSSRSSLASSRSPSRSPPPRHRHRCERERRRYSDYSRSPSPRRNPKADESDDSVKPWFKKKTVWATVATLASVAALMPAAVAAKASQDAAAASTRSARAVERSTNAVVNTSVAQGHQDHRGRYTGPRKQLPPPRDRSRGSYRSNESAHGYGPGAMERYGRRGTR